MNDVSDQLSSALDVTLLLVICGLLVAGVAGTALGLHRSRRRYLDRPLDGLSPVELGLLNSKPHAILALLVELRTSGLITPTGKTLDGPTDAAAIAQLAPASRHAFDEVRKYGALTRSLLLDDDGALARLRSDLIDRGYIVGRPGAHELWPIIAVVVVTCVCIQASGAIGVAL